MLRYLRLIVLIRLLLPQLDILHRILLRNRFGATLLAFLTVTLLSGVLVTYIDPGIGSPWKGMWWAWQTVTTVGYGDIIPDSAVGKIFGALLMLFGVGLFSLVSANLAAYFIERGRRQEKKLEPAMKKRLMELEDKLCCIETLLKQLVSEDSKEPDDG